MLFNIEHDGGDCIVGYLVPDGYSGAARLRVISAGTTLLETRTTDPRPALVVAGRHEDGLCGFVIDETRIPGLSHLADVEIREAETGALVYSRPKPHRLRKKIIRFETSYLPMSRVDLSMADRFQYFMLKIEDLGRETSTQMFVIQNVDSIYLSGSVFYKSVQHLLDGGFETIVVLREPHEELAERLLILKTTRHLQRPFFSERETMRLAPAIEFASGLTFADARALRRDMRSMPREVAMLLVDPVTRLLTSASPDELPHAMAVARALDVLAGCAVVGLRDDPEGLAQALGALTGVSPAMIDGPPTLSNVPILAATLRETGCADFLFEKDMELYHHVADAARLSAAPSDASQRGQT